ncbi:MAG TPA: hypothetical protein VFY71_08435 [Planctomycetota bacterium]|nr:hypothetical protein [Planctomycetota bacterium]
MTKGRRIPDLLATDSGDGSQIHDTISVLLNTTAPAPPWTDAGFALAGTPGAAWLMAFGPLTPGSVVELSLSGAQPGAPAVLLLGTAVIDAPFKGGTLVPQPQLLLGGFAVEPDGGLQLQGHWPTTPAGLQIVGQWWIADAGGPAGFAASNGVSGVVP